MTNAANPDLNVRRLRGLSADGLQPPRFTRDVVGADRREGWESNHR